MLNKVILIGNLGKDPEVRHLDNGGVVANFSMATNESYKDKQGQKQTVTEWHSVVVWGKVAEIVEQYVKSGSLIYVEGKLKTRSWEDKDGNKRYTTEVVLEQYGGVLKMLSSDKVSQRETHPEAEENEPPF